MPGLVATCALFSRGAIKPSLIVIGFKPAIPKLKTYLLGPSQTLIRGSDQHTKMSLNKCTNVSNVTNGIFNVTPEKYKSNKWRIMCNFNFFKCRYLTISHLRYKIEHLKPYTYLFLPLPADSHPTLSLVQRNTKKPECFFHLWQSDNVCGWTVLQMCHRLWKSFYEHFQFVPTNLSYQATHIQ